MLWKDLVNTRYRSEMESISEQRDYIRRVKTGVQKFIHDTCGAAGKKEDECYVRKLGSSKTIPAIPVSIREQFLDWFGTHLNNCFLDYETSAGILAFQKHSIKEDVKAEVVSEDDE